MKGYGTVDGIFALISMLEKVMEDGEPNNDDVGEITRKKVERALKK
jgi:hypothetical protein